MLGDAMAKHVVYARGWELMTPEESDSTRLHLAESGRSAPCLGPRAQMVPMFTRDGDLLLLARDGAIRMHTFDAPQDDFGNVARSVDELLSRLASDEPLPCDLRAPVAPRSSSALSVRHQG